MNTLDPGRRQHYGDFYGADYRRRDESLPFVTVMGNCQAESLRILLDSSGAVESFPHSPGPRVHRRGHRPAHAGPRPHRRAGHPADP
ncbi:hypothetical protein QP028_11485 [Corynebacterium suedekumii]|nr:hypothetical protein QP028_11485 [Corynebacterium suedekumii]